MLTIFFLAGTEFPDVSKATANGKPITGLFGDASYLQNEFVDIVLKQGTAVTAAGEVSSAMSAAKAAVNHIHDWWHGTDAGTFVSI